MDSKAKRVDFAKDLFNHLYAVKSILRTEEVNRAAKGLFLVGRGYSTGIRMEVAVEVGYKTDKDGISSPFVHIVPDHEKETNPLLLLVAKLFLNELFPLRTSFGPTSEPYTPEYSSWDYFEPIIEYENGDITPEEVAGRIAKKLAYFHASMRGVADTNYTAEYPKRILSAVNPVLTDIMGDAKSRADGRIASNPGKIRYD